jgi:hypothetical protein
MMAIARSLYARITNPFSGENRRMANGLGSTGLARIASTSGTRIAPRAATFYRAIMFMTIEENQFGDSILT